MRPMPAMRPLTALLLCASLAAALLAAGCSRETSPTNTQRLSGYAQGTTYALQWWYPPAPQEPQAARVDEATIAAAVEGELR
jgi:hypothetical protein